MAFYSIDVYPGDGATKTFALTFEFISRDSVFVYSVDDTTKAETALTVVTSGNPSSGQYKWDSDKQITLGDALPTGTSVKIQRDTTIDLQIVQWKDGSYIIAEDLNTSDKQWLYNLQELEDHIDQLNGSSSGAAVKKITGTAPVEVDSTNAQEPNISVDETVSTDNPNALTSDTRLMSEKAIDSAFSQAVGASGVYPPAGVTAKTGKLRIDDTGAEPKQFYWNGTAWVQIPTKGDKGDQGIPGPPPGLQDPAATAANVPLKANNVLGDATAAVTADGDGDLRFDFGIPVGQKGDKGDQGIEGIEGPVGPPPGLQSPAATATNVSLQPGNVLGQAYASVSADGSGDLKFNFGIPVGQRGEKGDVGDGVNYLGEIDATTAPAPSDPVNGDFYVNTVEGTSSWPGLGAVHVNSRLIYNSNTGQWDQYDPLDNVWREVGGEVYPVNAAADVKIGGTLPSAPNIRLLADGQAFFENTVSGPKFSSRNAASTNKLWSGGLSGVGTETSYIRADGSASFAGVVQIDGSFDNEYALRLKNSSSTKPSGVLIDLPNTSADVNPAIRVKVKDGVDTALISTDGSATFAGNVSVGVFDAAATGKDGTQIASNGAIQVKRSAGDRAVLLANNDLTRTFEIYANGDTRIGGTLPSAPNISLNADGSAVLNGYLLSQDTVRDKFTRINETGSISVRNNGTGQNLDDSVYRLFRGGTANANVKRIEYSDGSIHLGGDNVLTSGGALNAPNISLNADGVIKFANSELGQYGDQTFSLKNTNNAPIDFFTNNTQRMRLNNVGDVLIGGTLPLAPNISLNANGTIQAGGDANAGVAGTKIFSEGSITVCRNGTDVAFNTKAEGSTTTTSQILADGSATFAGNVTTDSSFIAAGLSIQNASESPILLVGNETQNLFSIDNNGTTKIGGTLPGLPNISLNASDGSASFTGGVTAGDYQAGNGVRIQGYADVSIRQDSSLASSSSVINIYKGGFTGSDRTVSIKNDGSATFAGDVICGGYVPGNVNTYGIRLNASANQVAIRTATSSTDTAFKITGGGSDTAVITTAGSATFAGQVFAGSTETKDITPLVAVNQSASATKPTLFLRNRSTDSSAKLIQGLQGTTTNVVFEVFGNGSATFARNVTSGGPDIFTGTDKGSIIGYEGNIGACCGASSSAFRAWTQGTSTPTVDILADGSATFAGDVKVGGNANLGTERGVRLWADGRMQVSRNPDDVGEVISVYAWGETASQVAIYADGSATFEGNITAANVTFNLEPENPDNYTTTEEEYEVEVPVLRPDGPVTADLVDGEPEQEMQTITRTREVKTYTGPTMDVKDTLLKITEALTQLKTAAASATTCEELRTAIDTALADV